MINTLNALPAPDKKVKLMKVQACSCGSTLFTLKEKDVSGGLIAACDNCGKKTELQKSSRLLWEVL